MKIEAGQTYLGNGYPRVLIRMKGRIRGSTTFIVFKVMAGGEFKLDEMHHDVIEDLAADGTWELIPGGDGGR